MIKRIISGAVYVVILTAFFLLRQFIDYRIFDLLIYFMMVVGTFEIARATKELTIKGSFILSILYALALIPTYYICEHIWFSGYGKLAVIYLFALMIIINLVLAIIFNAEPKTFLWTALLYVYPALLLYVMFLTNATQPNAFIMLILAFVISSIFARRITKPIKKMREAAKSIATGNYKEKIPITSQDEIGQLAESFNEKCYEVPVGFKYISSKNDEVDAVLGGDAG